jgi:hypothetical protein
MSNDWLTSDLWRAHVSWLTPPWVGLTAEGRGDFDAARWLEVMEAAHYRTIIFYVKHHDGYCAYPSRYLTVKPERDFLGECVAEVRRRGLRIVCYYSSFLDEVTGNEHPDWQVLGRDGTPPPTWSSTQWPGAYCCLNHPGYRDLVLGQLTELRDLYEPDGFWMDVFEPMTGENCFCPSCQEKYRQATGGSLLDTRDNAWYDSCVADLMREIREIADGSARPCMVTANCGRRSPVVDGYCDLLTHEAFTSTMISSLGRAFRPLGKPFETTCRLYSAVGTWAIRGHDRVLLESMAAVVHGGACCQELSPTHTGTITEEAARRVAEVGGYIRGIEEYLTDTEPVLDAAIVLPETSYGAIYECPPPGGWDTVLRERDIPVAYVYPDADLSPYHLVVLDGRAPLTEALAQKVAGFVRAGGGLIVEGEAAGLGTSAGSLMAEVLGLGEASSLGAGTYYLSGLHPDLAEDMGADDLVVEGTAHRVALRGAEPLGFYRYEFAPRRDGWRTYHNLPPARARSEEAAITLHRYGEGRALFVACALTTAELRDHRYHEHDVREYPTQLAANLARFMIGEPLLRGTTAAGVEMVVNRQGSRYVVHLLNHYAGGPYFDNRRGLLRLADVLVSVNASRVGPLTKAAEVSGGEARPLPIRREGRWLEVLLPRLSVHGLVLLER